MKFLLALITLTVLLGVYGHEPKTFTTLEDVLVHPVIPANREETRVRRGAATIEKNNTLTFIEEKLIQHSQALEHLLKQTQRNEDLTKRLIENLGHFVDKPDMPEKIEVHHQSRRSYDDTDHPIVQLGKRIPTYGNMYKNMVMNHIRNAPEPPVIVEHNPASNFLSRRSLGGKKVENKGLISNWCSVAITCKEDGRQVCGYDDNFGYGRFQSVCHMLKVNCYWHYNFGLVPKCHPS